MCMGALSASTGKLPLHRERRSAHRLFRDRLCRACGRLSESEYLRDQFPACGSLHATLNHVPAVDPDLARPGRRPRPRLVRASDGGSTSGLPQSAKATGSKRRCTGCWDISQPSGALSRQGKRVASTDGGTAAITRPNPLRPARTRRNRLLTFGVCLTGCL